MRRVSILEAKSSVVYGVVNISREFIEGKENRVVCIIEKYYAKSIN